MQELFHKLGCRDEGPISILNYYVSILKKWLIVGSSAPSHVVLGIVIAPLPQWSFSGQSYLQSNRCLMYIVLSP